MTDIVLDEAFDTVVDVVTIARNNPWVVGGAVAGGLIVGFGFGYFVAVKRMLSNFEKETALEISKARAFYAGLNKVDIDGAALSPQSVFAGIHGEEALEALRDYQGDAEVEIDQEDEDQIARLEASIAEKVSAIELEPEIESSNVFVDPMFDLEEETKYRSEDAPYIITHDEFYAGNRDYDTITCTYYEMDDTLVGEGDRPIEEVDKIVGEDHLVRFGHGSKDPNIVYIRNEILAIDFEIVKSTGSYLEEVLGMQKEDDKSLKHSDQRNVRRALRHGD